MSRITLVVDVESKRVVGKLLPGRSERGWLLTSAGVEADRERGPSKKPRGGIVVVITRNESLIPQRLNQSYPISSESDRRTSNVFLQRAVLHSKPENCRNAGLGCQ